MDQNVFALLGDDENEDPQVLVAKAPKLVKKEALKEEVKPVKVSAAKQEGPQTENGGRGGRGRGEGGRGRGEGRGGRGGRATRPFIDHNAAPVDEEVPVTERTDGEAGRGRGPRLGRGRGGRFSGDGRPPRREYERHDGTGRGHETEKRHGSGRGNWGKEGDEVKDTPEGEEVKPVEEAPVEVAAPEPLPEEPLKEEEKELSLDEYEAIMVEKKKALNKTSESKNVDPSAELKGLKAFTKTSIEEKGLDLGAIEKKKAEAERDKESAAKFKVFVETSFRIESSEAGRGERSERGGRGARGARGGGRFSDRPQSARGERAGSRGGERAGRGGERAGRGGDRGGERAGDRGGRGAAPLPGDEIHFPALV